MAAVERRQDLVELGPQLRRILRQLQTGARHLIGTHHARAAAVGDDADPAALGHRVVGEAGAEVHDFLGTGAGDDAALAGRGFPDGRVAGHGSRVRRRGAAAELGEAGAQHHQRLDGSEALGHVHEAAPIVDALHVGHHARCVRIVLEVVERLDYAHLGLVTDAQELVDTDAPALAGVGGLHADVARLRDEAQAALGRMQHHEADRVEAHLVGDHAHAVGTHQGDAALARDVGDLPLGLGSALAHLGEAGRDGDGRLDALFPTLLEHRSDLVPTDGQQGQVGGFGEFVDARVCLQAEELAAFGIHRIARRPVVALVEGEEAR